MFFWEIITITFQIKFDYVNIECTPIDYRTFVGTSTKNDKKKKST